MIKGVFIGISNYNNFDVRKLRNNGVTDVYVKTNRLTPPTYTTTLPVVLNRLRGTHIRVHAWITCFNNGVFFIDPSDTTQRETMLYYVKKLTNYNLDGISFDYIRYSGVAPNRAIDKVPHGYLNINSWLDKAQDIIRTNMDDCIISASVMPEMYANKDLYGQDYQSMSEYLDWILPMTYVGDYKATPEWVGKVTKFVHDRVNDCLVLPTLETYKSETNTTLKTRTELQIERDYALKNGADGYNLFKYGMIKEYP